MTQLPHFFIHFDLIQDKPAFLKLKDEWTELYQQNLLSDTLFLPFEWNRIWYDTFFEDLSDSDTQLKIIVGRDVDGKALFILPLLSWKRFGISQLRWIGDPVSQYGAVLYDPKIDLNEVMQQAIAFIKKSIKTDLLILSGVFETSPLADALQSGGVKQFGTHIAPFIDLSQFSSVDGYWKSRSKSMTKQLRRLRRKFSLEQGDVQFRMVHGYEDDADYYISLALRMKEQNLKANNVYSSAFATGKMEKFFVSLAQNNYEGLLISVLSCDGRVVAVEVGLEQETYYVSHLGVYDWDYYKYSPGKLQMVDTVQYLFERGIQTVDLLPPDDAYKYLLANKTEGIVDYGVPLSLKGELYQRAVLENIRPIAKRLKNNLASRQVPKKCKKVLSLVSGSIKSRKS